MHTGEQASTAELQPGELYCSCQHQCLLMLLALWDTLGRGPRVLIGDNQSLAGLLDSVAGSPATGPKSNSNGFMYQHN